MNIKDNVIEMSRWSDLHYHTRQNSMLQEVAEYHRPFKNVVAMPNTNPPVTYPAIDGFTRMTYVEQISRAIGKRSVNIIVPMYITEKTSPSDIYRAKDSGFIVAKLYPRDPKEKSGTTGSGSGVDLDQIERLYPTFEMMAERGMILSIHGEYPQVADDREKTLRFLEILSRIIKAFPSLKIVLEHLTTKEEVEFVKKHPTVYGTITLHHMDFTDAEKDGHLFCRPPLKKEEDRLALLEAAMSGNPKFFFGSDSAPHHRKLKDGVNPKPGCFTAPVLIQRVTTIFVNHGKIEMLEGFTSVFGPMFYGLKLTKDRVIIERTDEPLKLFHKGDAYCPYEHYTHSHPIEWRIKEVVVYDR